MSKLEQRLPFKPGGVVWVYNPGNQEAKAVNLGHPTDIVRKPKNNKKP